MSLISNLSPTCKQASRLQSDALDRPLGVTQRIGLRIHLLLCKWCRRYGQQIAFLRAAGNKCVDHPEHLPAASLSPEACKRIKRRLEIEGK